MSKFGKKMWKVFEGIADPAASEFFNQNTQSTEAVAQYADSIDIFLFKGQADFLYEKLLKLKKSRESGEIIGTNDYFYDFEKPIKEYFGL